MLSQFCCYIKRKPLTTFKIEISPITDADNNNGDSITKLEIEVWHLISSKTGEEQKKEVVVEIQRDLPEVLFNNIHTLMDILDPDVGDSKISISAILCNTHLKEPPFDKKRIKGKSYPEAMRFLEEITERYRGLTPERMRLVAPR